MEKPGKKIFVVFNPMAGNAEQSAEIHAGVAKYFPQPEWTSEIYETTGKEDVSALCHDACKRGASLVIAAGGDGTVVEVANGLIQSDTLLGILPLGTGNDLARILNIPLDLHEAFGVLAGDHHIIEIDALKVDDRYFLSNVSVGITPHMMKDTQSEQKKRFGRLAYIWTMIKQSSIFRLHRYTLTIDGQPFSVHASEVMVSNTTLLETLPDLFGPPVDLNDGQLEIYLVTAQTWGDYVRMIWDLIRRPGKSAAKLFHLSLKNSIRIETASRSPQLVQADGEVIGYTPVEVELVRKAVRVVSSVPTPESTPSEVGIPAIGMTAG